MSLTFLCSRRDRAKSLVRRMDWNGLESLFDRSYISYQGWRGGGWPFPATNGFRRGIELLMVPRGQISPSFTEIRHCPECSMGDQGESHSHEVRIRKKDCAPPSCRCQKLHSLISWNSLKRLDHVKKIKIFWQNGWFWVKVRVSKGFLNFEDKPLMSCRLCHFPRS
jgi:hypothetical protein